MVSGARFLARNPQVGLFWEEKRWFRSVTWERPKHCEEATTTAFLALQESVDCQAMERGWLS